VPRHRLAEPGQPVGSGWGVGRTADRRDPLAAAAEEMIGRHRRAGGLRGVDIADRERLGRATEEHDGHAGVGQRAWQRIGPRYRDRQHAVDIAVPQVPEQFRTRGLIVHPHQDHVHVTIRQLGECAACDAAEERIGERATEERVVERHVIRRRHDERDRKRAARDQRAGRSIRYVAGRGDRSLHDVRDLRVDVPDAVDDARHGCPRHASGARDVFERRCSARRRDVRVHGRSL
jgi:hypothetical protein